MSEGKKGLSEEVRAALQAVLGELYPVFIFYGLYAAVVFLYDGLQPFKPLPLGAANLIAFTTSPFSFVEATPPYSSSTTVGLYNNFLLVAVLMVFLAMYNLILSRSLKPFVTLPSVFGAGVAGSYLVSLSIWILSKQPATGTSIIGFTVVAAIVVTTLADLISQLRLIVAGERSARTYLRAYAVLILFGVASLIALNSYIVGNPSFLLHLVGGAASGGVLVLWMLSRQ